MHKTSFLLTLLIVAVPMSAHAAVVTFLTSGTSYSTPSDWDNSNNIIECIGAGGSNAGGGGAYAKITNLTISGSVAYSVATGGSQADTTFNSTSLVCDAGNNSSIGGLAANSTGSTKFNGGSGGGGGGGGAGGTTSAGSDASGGNGGNAGTVNGGAGGATGVPSSAGSPGGDGTVWDATHGAGGGGGLGADGEGPPGDCNTNGRNGGNGGNYGGGGGAGGTNGGDNVCSPGSPGVGAQGIIVVTYTPLVVTRVKVGWKVFPGGAFKILPGGKIKFY